MVDTIKEKDSRDKEINKDLLKEVSVLREDLSLLTKKVSAQAEDKMNQMKERGKEMKNDLEKGAYKLGEKVRETMEDTEGKIREGSEYLVYQTKEHPFIVLASSFILGMLIGKIFSSSDK